MTDDTERIDLLENAVVRLVDRDAELAQRADNQLLFLDELQRRTDELADKLAKVVLALMEADAAILERVAAIEALLPPGTIIEFNPHLKERTERRWFKKLGRASRRD